MSKIYQKMYLQHKNRSKSVLGGFMHNVFFENCCPKFHPLSFNRAGFTLIELLVVVLIIGILAAVALPQYRRAVVKARTARVLPLLRSLAEAEERFYMANGYYASDLSDLDVAVSDMKLPDGKGVKWKIVENDSVVAAYNYLVDMPSVGYYFRHGTSSHPIRGKFYCNGYDSDIKAWVCQSLGEPVYSWTPWFTYW